MLQRRTLILAVLAGVFVGAVAPKIFAPLFAPRPVESAADKKPAGGADGKIKLTSAQVEAAKIETEKIGPGPLTRSIVAPARVTPDPDKVARVAAKVAGTVAEMRKKLGDPVHAGETVAIVDSREVADAKSEFLAASVSHELQSALFQREKGLFEKKITAEQLFLKSKTAFAEAKLRLDLARQKLATLDVSDSELANLPREAPGALRRKEIRAPISGRVIERLVSLGQPVGGEGQSKELYVISDLSIVEADLAVPVTDLAFMHEGQNVTLSTPEGRNAPGVVVFVNAMLTPETRTGHAIASFKNPDFSLRPGSVLNATVTLAQTPVRVRVPRTALQTIDNENVVFVRTPEGFDKRKVETGASSDDFVEIKSGLEPGETVATVNSFILKADLGKGSIAEE